jgi:hypothetical protein
MIISDIGSLSWMLRYEIAYNNHHRMDATVIGVRARRRRPSSHPSGSCPDLGHIGPDPGPSATNVERSSWRTGPPAAKLACAKPF